MFKDFTSDELDKFGGIVNIRDVKKRQIVFREGEPSRGFFLVHIGKVRVYRIADDGKVRTIHIVPAGGSFAEVAVFLNGGYPACAETLEDSILYEISKERFLKLVSGDVGICLKLLAGMAHWIRVLLSLVDNLSMSSAEGRVGHYLLSLVADGSPAAHPAIRLPAKKNIVSSHIGITPESFSRTLNLLRRRRMIKIDRKGTIVIADVDALRRLAGHIE